jgi:hypothetical protein
VQVFSFDPYSIVCLHLIGLSASHTPYYLSPPCTQSSGFYYLCELNKLCVLCLHFYITVLVPMQPQSSKYSIYTLSANIAGSSY